MNDRENERRGISLNKSDYPEIYGRSDGGETYPAADAEEIYPSVKNAEVYPAAEIYPDAEILSAQKKAELNPYAGAGEIYAANAAKVSYEDAEAFGSYLFSGERILWCGHGKPPKNKNSAPPLPFALFWTGFSVFWTALAVSGAGVMGLFGVPFILIGVGMFVGIFKGMAPVKYAVTNKRLMTINGKNFYMEYLDKIADVRIYQRTKGIADISCSFEYTADMRSSAGVMEFCGLSSSEAESVRRLIIAESAREKTQKK